MTPFQIIALSILAIVLVVQFVLPNVKLPKRSNTMHSIEAVMAIKESSNNPQVVEACSQLLKALLG
jgi:hypothetical protein